MNKLLDSSRASPNSSFTIASSTLANHPEEIMAVNFALLVTGAKDVKSPAILDKIAAVFRSNDGATPPTAAEICR